MFTKALLWFIQYKIGGSQHSSYDFEVLTEVSPFELRVAFVKKALSIITGFFGFLMLHLIVFRLAVAYYMQKYQWNQERK